MSSEKKKKNPTKFTSFDKRLFLTLYFFYLFKFSKILQCQQHKNVFSYFKKQMNKGNVLFLFYFLKASWNMAIFFFFQILTFVPGTFTSMHRYHFWPKIFSDLKFRETRQKSIVF